ncbi:MAG: hypothetical protein WKG01_28880, partial [Kofleriaceae bacterium]
MKLRSASLLLSLALAGGCAKSNDVAPLQQEATALASSYSQQVDALERRAKELEGRARRAAGAPGIQDAVRVFNEARTQLVELRSMATRAPGVIAMAVGAAKPSKAAGSAAGSAAADPNESDPRWILERLIDEMRERFTVGIVEVNAKLNTMESWIYYGERYVAPTAPAPGAAPDEPPAAPEHDAPAPAAEEPAPTR